jgi:hypothetical protein
MIGCFPRLSRGNIRFLKKSCENQDEKFCLLGTATRGGFLFRIQRCVVVTFLSRFGTVLRRLKSYFGRAGVPADADSMVLTVITSVLGSSVPMTLTLSAAHCSAKTCASSL